MNCLTCNQIMSGIGHEMFHCARCGSLKLPDGTPGDFVVPADAIGRNPHQTLTMQELTERFYEVKSQRDKIMWTLSKIADMARDELAKEWISHPTSRVPEIESAAVSVLDEVRGSREFPKKTDFA